MIHLLSTFASRLRERGLHVLAAVAALLTNEPLENEVLALAGPSADLVGAGVGVAPDEFAVVPRRGPGPQVLLAAERDRDARGGVMLELVLPPFVRGRPQRVERAVGDESTENYIHIKKSEQPKHFSIKNIGKWANKTYKSD